MTWVEVHGVEHLDGVPWYDAPRPPVDHEHTAQSRGRLAGSFFERCACGAGRFDRGCWGFATEQEERLAQVVDVPQPRAPWWRRLVGAPR
jgi:hypothetical protein